MVGVGLEELRQQLEEPERRVALPLLQEGPRPAASLGRGRATTSGADRIASTRLDRQDRLRPHVVAPAVAQVVLVEESFADPQAEIAKLDLMRVVAEGDATGVGNAILPPVDDEAIHSASAALNARLPKTETHH